jgi:hypothetical protein
MGYGAALAAQGKTVHAPDFTPFVLALSLIHYRKSLIVIGIGLLLVIVLLPISF